MKIMKKISDKAKDNANNSAIKIAFLGDSVTQGCFEVYKKSDTCIEPVYDQNNAYHSHLSKILQNLFPSVPINMINAGISGDNAVRGFKRLEMDVLTANHDLVVVCFGLNDVTGGYGNLGNYINALENIFKSILEKDIEVIFMTPNMLNTEVSYQITDTQIRKIAENTKELQNSGMFDQYIDVAKELCEKYGIPVCDCYEKWKLLYKNGVDITELLANKINHPTREMNWLFAYSLIETMMQ